MRPPASTNSRRVDRGNPMTRRERRQFDAPVGEEPAGGDEEGVGTFATGCEGRLDLAARARFQDLDLDPRARAAACMSRSVASAGGALAGSTSTATRPPWAPARAGGPAAWPQLSVKKVDTGRIAARPGEAGDETKPDRSSPTPKTIGIVVVAAFGRKRTGAPGGDHGHLTADKIGRQPGRRSYLPSAQRYSTATLWPST